MEETPGGQGEGLLADPGHVRADAILIRKWAGVVDPVRVKTLIEKGYDLAERAADERGYAAVMKVIHGFAKLEQEEAKADKPAGSQDTYNTVIVDGNSGTIDERRTQLLGLIDQLRNRSGANDDPSVIDAAPNTEPSIQKEPEN